jgi:AcrR family transcriptional regulator
MAEIGGAAGITGSGIYRHFDSKSAILVALFDRVIDELLRDEATTLDTVADLRNALDQLIAGQVQFVVGNRELAQVYYSEINNVPEEDRRRCAASSGSIWRAGCTSSMSCTRTGPITEARTSCMR